MGHYRLEPTALPKLRPFNRSWYRPAALGKTLPNHVARSHMPSDLHRYLFCAAFAQEHNRSPRLPDFPASSPARTRQCDRRRGSPRASSTDFVSSRGWSLRARSRHTSPRTATTTFTRTQLSAGVSRSGRPPAYRRSPMTTSSRKQDSAVSPGRQRRSANSGSVHRVSGRRGLGQHFGAR